MTSGLVRPPLHAHVCVISRGPFELWFLARIQTFDPALNSFEEELLAGFGYFASIPIHHHSNASFVKGCR